MKLIKIHSYKWINTIEPNTILDETPMWKFDSIVEFKYLIDDDLLKCISEEYMIRYINERLISLSDIQYKFKYAIHTISDIDNDDISDITPFEYVILKINSPYVNYL
jgi:hypothetical protein